MWHKCGINSGAPRYSNYFDKYFYTIHSVITPVVSLVSFITCKFLKMDAPKTDATILKMDGTLETISVDGYHEKEVLRSSIVIGSFDVVGSPVDLFRFSDKDVEVLGVEMLKELICCDNIGFVDDLANNIVANGFLLYLYMNKHGCRLHKQGKLEENKYLADRGWKNIFGNVAVLAEAKDCKTGDLIKIPSSLAFGIATSILELQGKSMDVVFEEKGKQRENDDSVTDWICRRMIATKGEVDFEVIYQEAAKKFGF